MAANVHDMHLIVKPQGCIKRPTLSRRAALQCGMAKTKRRRASRPVHFLKEWRGRRRLTQEKAAERIGMSRENLSKLERGMISLNDDALPRIAKTYQCSIPDLFRSPKAAPKQEPTQNANSINDVGLFLALLEPLLRVLAQDDLVTRELLQSLSLSLEAARARGLTAADRRDLELLVETEVRRLSALFAKKEVRAAT